MATKDMALQMAGIRFEQTAKHPRPTWQCPVCRMRFRVEKMPKHALRCDSGRKLGG